VVDVFVVLSLAILTIFPAQWLDVCEIGETHLKHVQRGSAIPRGKYTMESINIFIDY